MARTSKPIPGVSQLTGLQNAIKLAISVAPGAEPDTYVVPSSSQPEPYLVIERPDADGVLRMRCECSGSTNGLLCKHVAAVTIHTDRQASRLLAHQAMQALEALLEEVAAFRRAAGS